MKTRIKRVLTRMVFMLMVVIVFALAVPANVSAETSCPTGMVSYWKFDEASGTIASDSVGTNHGTIYGATWTTGIVGSALSFDGGNDYVEIFDSSSLDISGSLTLEAWVRPSDVMIWGMGIIDKSSFVGAGGNYRLLIAHGTWKPKFSVRIDIWGGRNRDLDANTIINAYTWYHIVGTYDGSKMRLYINGELDKERSQSGSLYIDSYNVRIGQYLGPNRFFNGIVDEVAIYNRALSAAEIQEHYENGLASKGYCVVVDSDGDGLTDDEELAGWDITIYDCLGIPVDSYHVTSDPYQADEDGDGLNDLEEKEGWEVRYRVENPGAPPRWLWIEYPVTSNPGSADIDADNINDRKERVFKTDSNRANTDCDSAWDTTDGFEIDYVLNPLDFDTDDDGISDGMEIDLWLKAAGYSPEEPATIPADILNWAASKTNDPLIPAFVDIDPDTVNLRSKGKFITCYVELPSGYNVTSIDIGTPENPLVFLEEVIPAETDPKYDFVTDPDEYLTDHDEDGILERMVKFDRAAVQDILEVGDEVDIVVTGELTDGTPFEGSDTIRVIDKGGKKK